MNKFFHSDNLDGLPNPSVMKGLHYLHLSLKAIYPIASGENPT